MGLLETTMEGLGYAGDVADKLGGRALRGAIGGRPRELASVVPFSDSLGITNYDDRVSGRDLTDRFGITRKGDSGLTSHLLGAGTEMLLDPLTLAGAGLGAHALKGTETGQAALHHAGQFLHGEEGWLKVQPWANNSNISDLWRARADAVGPMFPGGAEKLADILSGVRNDPSNRWSYLAEELLRHPHADRIAGEIPEGTRFLGNGAEAAALKAPDGSVIRLSPTESEYGSAGRANIPEILQPFRSIDFPEGREAAPWRVEHLPLVQPINRNEQEAHELERLLKQAVNSGQMHPEIADTYRDVFSGLRDDARDAAWKLKEGIWDHRRDLDPWDFHRYNVSTTPEGKYIGHDGGMVKSKKASAPIPPPFTAPYPDDMRLLRAIRRKGGPEAVREAMAAGNEMGTRGQGLDIPGLDAWTTRNDREYITKFLEEWGAKFPKGQATSPSDDMSGALDAIRLPRAVPSDGPFDLSRFQANAPLTPETLPKDVNVRTNPLLKAIRDFASDESGSLHLKYDDKELPGVLARSDPEWVNNRTFYNGTGTSGLTLADLDPRKTKPDNLFGRGIYTTDSTDIAGQYADARFKPAIRDFMQGFLDDNSVTDLMEHVPQRDLVELLGRAGASRPDLLLPMPQDLASDLARQIMSGAVPMDNPAVQEIVRLYADKLGRHAGGFPSRSIYQGQSDFGKILDVDKQLGLKEQNRLQDALLPIGEAADEATKGLRGGRIVSSSPARDSIQGARNTEGLIRAAMGANSMLDPAHPDALIRALKEFGYDALTHTGGTRVGRGERLHQVVIGLDPNDKFGLGRATPYKTWEALRDEAGHVGPLGEAGADPGKMLAAWAGVAGAGGLLTYLLNRSGNPYLTTNPGSN